MLTSFNAISLGDRVYTLEMFGHMWACTWNSSWNTPDKGFGSFANMLRMSQGCATDKKYWKGLIDFLENKKINKKNSRILSISRQS